MESIGILFVWAVLGALGLLLLFLPAGIARSRGHVQTVWVFVLCLFAGWTVIGWVVALVWASVGPVNPGASAVGYWSDQFRREACDPIPADWRPDAESGNDKAVRGDQKGQEM